MYNFFSCIRLNYYFLLFFSNLTYLEGLKAEKKTDIARRSNDTIYLMSNQLSTEDSMKSLKRLSVYHRLAERVQLPYYLHTIPMSFTYYPHTILFCHHILFHPILHSHIQFFTTTFMILIFVCVYAACFYVCGCIYVCIYICTVCLYICICMCLCIY